MARSVIFLRVWKEGEALGHPFQADVAQPGNGPIRQERCHLPSSTGPGAGWDVPVVALWAGGFTGVYHYFDLSCPGPYHHHFADVAACLRERCGHAAP